MNNLTMGESGELCRNGDETPMENGPEENEVFNIGKRPQPRHHPFLGFLSKAIASGTTSEQLISLICSTQYQLAIYKTRKNTSTVTTAFTSTDASNLLLAAAEVASITGSSRGNTLRLVKYVVYEEDRWSGSEAFETALVRGRSGLPMTLVADAGFMVLSNPKRKILELASLKFVCDIEDSDAQWQIASIKLLGTLSSKGGVKSRELLAKRMKNIVNLNQYLVHEIVGQANRALKCTQLSKEKPLSREEADKDDPLLVALNEYKKHLNKKERGGGGQQKEGMWQRDFCGQEKLHQQHSNLNLCTNRANSTDSVKEYKGGTTRNKSMNAAPQILEGSKDKTEQGNQQKTHNNNKPPPLKRGDGYSEMLRLKNRTTSSLAAKRNGQHLEARMCKKRMLHEEHASVRDKQPQQHIHNPDSLRQNEWYHDQKRIIIGEKDNSGSRVAVGGIEESVATTDICNSNPMTNEKEDGFISQNALHDSAFYSSCESTSSPVEVGVGTVSALHHEADNETFCREGDEAQPEEILNGESPRHVDVDCQEGRKYEVLLGHGWKSMAHTPSQAQQLTGGGLLCIHYDFLPQSADMDEPGELKLRDNGTAIVDLKSMDQSGAPLSYEGSYVSRVAKSIQSNSVLRFTNGHFVLEPVNVIVQGLRNDFAEASKGPKRRLLHTPKPQHGHCAKIGDNQCESSSLQHDRGGGGPMDTTLGGIIGHMDDLKAKLPKMGSRVEKSKDYRK